MSAIDMYVNELCENAKTTVELLEVYTRIHNTNTKGMSYAEFSIHRAIISELEARITIWVLHDNGYDLNCEQNLWVKK